VIELYYMARLLFPGRLLHGKSIKGIKREKEGVRVGSEELRFEATRRRKRRDQRSSWQIRF